MTKKLKNMGNLLNDVSVKRSNGYGYNYGYGYGYNAASGKPSPWYKPWNK